jgi:hypothetical protein
VVGTGRETNKALQFVVMVLCHLGERELSLARGHTVSLLSQKIKQEGCMLLLSLID